MGRSRELSALTNYVSESGGEVTLENVADISLSGGIYFGGTGSANYQDDYEEGTWIPTLGGSGYTFGTHTGIYVKIGRMVYVTAFLSITAVGTNTSNLSISGFPFNANSANNAYQVSVVRELSFTGRLYATLIYFNTTIGQINSMDGVTSGDNEIFTIGNYGLSLTYIST